MSTNYVYLLQQREFLKTKEDIFKVGMTTQENHERFKQYPKGSILLFQMICKNCKDMEKQILTSFKEIFNHRKDIGNEYFQGNYQNMIDIIYSAIKSEKEQKEKNEQNDEYKEEDEETPYQITTFEEWIKYNKINKIIITNKKKEEGYVRFKGQLWRLFYDKNRFDYDEGYMEHLSGFIEHNQPDVQRMVMPENVLVSYSEMTDLIDQYKHKITDEIINWSAYRCLTFEEKENYYSLDEYKKYKFVNVEYDVDRIHQDIIKKCYNKKYEVYELKYHEYAIYTTGGSSVEYFILDSLTFTFTPVDELINNKILTNTYSGERSLYVKNTIDINIVDNILNSLIDDREIKRQYKKLAYNLLVEREESQTIIFYDYNNCLLTTWLRELVYTLNGNKKYMLSCDYYENKIEFRKIIKENKPRCVIIRPINKISIETQIDDFIKLGFKNIIVCQDDKKNNMYNIANYRTYLLDNKDVILNCIKKENNNEVYIWEHHIQHDDSIFYNQKSLLTNYLKWCCIK